MLFPRVMLNIRKHLFLSRAATVTAALLAVVFVQLTAWAQDSVSVSQIDPRLIEIVEEVKARTRASNDANQAEQIDGLEVDYEARRYLDALSDLQTFAYSENVEKIREAMQLVSSSEGFSNGPAVAQITNLYLEFADTLEKQASPERQQAVVEPFFQSGSWFEKYAALSLSSSLYFSQNQRQVALQKAQMAMALIPNSDENNLFAEFAKKQTTATIAHLHNLQGNTDLAIQTSLEYLRLTDGMHEDPRSGIDIINNLIFSHSYRREHASLTYLSKQLLEIEKFGTSSVPGLSELRVAQVKNLTGNFSSALDHANLSLSKAENASIKSSARTNRAIALAGLGRITEVRAYATEADIDLSPEHLLTQETGRDRLYLGFLIAQSQDQALATKLFNRQIDVTSQKFLTNNSRDTTAMLADLENSRGRQSHA